MSDNIKSGFRATSIFSIDKEKIINKLSNLPHEDELIEGLEQTTKTEAFVKILSDVRNPKYKVTIPRGKNFIVAWVNV